MVGKTTNLPPVPLAGILAIEDLIMTFKTDSSNMCHYGITTNNFERHLPDVVRQAAMPHVIMERHSWLDTT